MLIRLPDHALIRPLLPSDYLPELGPGKANESYRSELEKLTPEVLGLRDANMARCCIAGLWLHHNFLDESHTISQELSTPEGSYWHGIMHRREPDPGNAKYWFHRVGTYPVIDKLAELFESIGDEPNTPFHFIDFCERVRGTGSEDETSARKIQLAEWALLFDHCWKHAV